MAYVVLMEVSYSSSIAIRSKLHYAQSLEREFHDLLLLQPSDHKSLLRFLLSTLQTNECFQNVFVDGH